MIARHFGPRLESKGVEFRLWAPAARQIELVTDRAYTMRPDRNGWYSFAVADVRAGTLYRFRIDGETDIPDPASAFQPHDVSGPSEIIDHDHYLWSATTWRGRP